MFFNTIVLQIRWTEFTDGICEFAGGIWEFADGIQWLRAKDFSYLSYHICLRQFSDEKLPIDKTCFSTIVTVDRNLPTEFVKMPTEFDDTDHNIFRIYRIAFADGNFMT